MDENEVAPDDVVFHKFYQMKVSNRKVKKAKHKADDEVDDLTGLDDVDVRDGDDSNDDEIDALLDRDEGKEMGSGGEDEPEDEDGDESEGEFDYDKMEHTFDMEEDEDEELDEEDSDTSPKKKNKKGSIVETMDNDSDDSYGSEDDFDLGEYPESEPEDDDSDTSIEVGDVVSDDESKPGKKRISTISDKGVKTGKSAGEGKAKKTKKRQAAVVEVPAVQKGKHKSPFASYQEYEDIIERGEAPTGKGEKSKRKRAKSSKN